MTEIVGLLAVGATLGGFVRGFSGFGGPMVLIPVLGILYPPSMAVWIIALVDLPPNVFLIPTSWRHATSRKYIPLIVGSLLTLPVGAYVLVAIDPLIMRRVICVAIVLACVVLICGWMYRGTIRSTGWLAIGATSGLVAGATMIAVVTSVFLNAASRDAQANRANFIFWGCATGIAMILLLAGHQTAAAAHAPAIVMVAVLYFLGCVAGALAQRRYKSPYVRQATLTLIVAVAVTSFIASYGVFGLAHGHH